MSIKFNRQKPILRLCACGCGDPVTKPKNRFIKGHHRRGAIDSQESKDKRENTIKYGKPILLAQLCECNCLEYAEPGNRFIRGHENRNPSDEKRKRISLATTGEKNGMYGKHHSAESNRKNSESNTGKIVTDETRALQSKNSAVKGKPGLRTGSHPTPETLALMRASALARPPMTEETKELLSELRKKDWQRTEYREANIKMNKDKWADPEYMARHIRQQKELWSDPEYAKWRGQRFHLRPNKPETVLLNILDQLYPGEWKYTGDFSFMINGKNPDFTNINGQKKLIELFGDYWHKDKNPQDRIDTFKPYGWDTLVIWQRELKNLTRVRFKIHGFMKKEHDARVQ